MGKKESAMPHTFAALHQVARVKVVERGGTRLLDLLGRKDPGPGLAAAKRTA